MGIQVSVVSPGAIWTPIWGKIASEGERVLADAPDAVADLYRDTYLRFLQANEDGARNQRDQARRCRRRVHARSTAAKPRTRYRVGADVRRGTLLARLLPDSVIDGMFRPIVTAAPAAKEEQRA
ncbi:short chain dehydrogenase [Pseudomonas aeruginosa]|nr:short chain dehydrogenase [Pseudomonas aeruginosa]